MNYYHWWVQSSRQDETPYFACSGPSPDPVDESKKKDKFFLFVNLRQLDLKILFL